MSAEENKTLVRRLIAELNKGKAGAMAAIEEFYASDVVFHSADGEDIRGRENFKRHSSEHIFAAIPNPYFDVEDITAEGDEVVRRFTITGIQTGELRYPINTVVTSRKVTLHAISIDRIVEGKIVEEWAWFDTIGAMPQLNP